MVRLSRMTPLVQLVSARRAWLAQMLVATALTLVSNASGPPLARAQVATSSPGSEEGVARELEQRLLAPCCWNQTLEIHDSPLASELRSKIRAQLRAGASAQQIEDDFARRYGERVRAVPRGGDSRLAIVAAVALAMLASGVALFVAARRWMRGKSSEASHRDGATDGPADRYDALLDRELRRDA